MHFENCIKSNSGLNLFIQKKIILYKVAVLLSTKKSTIFQAAAVSLYHPGKDKHWPAFRCLTNESASTEWWVSCILFKEFPYKMSRSGMSSNPTAASENSAQKPLKKSVFLFALFFPLFISIWLKATGFNCVCRVFFSEVSFFFIHHRERKGEQTWGRTLGKCFHSALPHTHSNREVKKYKCKRICSELICEIKCYSCLGTESFINLMKDIGEEGFWEREKKTGHQKNPENGRDLRGNELQGRVATHSYVNNFIHALVSGAARLSNRRVVCVTLMCALYTVKQKKSYFPMNLLHYFGFFK